MMELLEVNGKRWYVEEFYTPEGNLGTVIIYDEDKNPIGEFYDPSEAIRFLDGIQ